MGQRCGGMCFHSFSWEVCVFSLSNPLVFKLETIARVTFIESEVFVSKTSGDGVEATWSCGARALPGLGICGEWFLWTACCRWMYCVLPLPQATPAISWDLLWDLTTKGCSCYCFPCINCRQSWIFVIHPGQKSRKAVLNNVLLLWICTQELSRIQPTPVKLVLSCSLQGF